MEHFNYLLALMKRITGKVCFRLHVPSAMSCYNVLANMSQTFWKRHGGCFVCM